MWHHAKVLARSGGSDNQERILDSEHGTNVTVRDLFGNMPVRVKQRVGMAEDNHLVGKELARLKHDVTAIMLAFAQPVKIKVTDSVSKKSYTLKYIEDDTTNKSHFDVSAICGLLVQARYLETFDKSQWKTISAQSSLLSIRAAISLDPVPTKSLQFMSFGIRPISKAGTATPFLEEINRIFADSSFGVYDVDHSEVSASRGQHTLRELNGLSKGADRWPMFYIRIDTRTSKSTILKCDDSSLDHQAQRIVRKAVELLKSMIFQFLDVHHFRPHSRKRKRFEPGNDNTRPARNLIRGESAPEATGSDFQQTSTAQEPLRRVLRSPFESWTRAKSGRKGGLEDIVAGLPASKSPELAMRSKQSQEKSTTSKQDLVEIGRLALGEKVINSTRVQEDAQILVADIEREEEERVLPTFIQPEIPGKDLSNSGGFDAGEGPDETIEWRNPTTGATAMINARTGQVVLQAYDRPTGQSKYFCHSARKASDNTVNASKRLTVGRTKGQLLVDENSWLGKMLHGVSGTTHSCNEQAIASYVTEEVLQEQKCCHGRFNHCNSGKPPDYSSQGNADFQGKLSKQALANAKVIAQVDAKFILVKIKTMSSSDAPAEVSDAGVALVLIDQHAADERVQVEWLYQQICDGVQAHLTKPLQFDIPAKEVVLFKQHQRRFSSLGIDYDLVQTTAESQHRSVSAQNPTSSRPHSPFTRPESAVKASRKKPPVTEHRLVISAIPAPIAERCKAEPKLLIDILRTEIWSPSTSTLSITAPSNDSSSGPTSWITKLSTYPRGIVEMLNSRACRSAIMFNDELRLGECQVLVKKLARCAFPFLCAHGRPSVAVLGGLPTDVDVADALTPGIGSEAQIRRSRNEGGNAWVEGKSFGAAWTTWMDSSSECLE